MTHYTGIRCDNCRHWTRIGPDSGKCGMAERHVPQVMSSGHYCTDHDHVGDVPTWTVTIDGWHKIELRAPTKSQATKLALDMANYHVSVKRKKVTPQGEEGEG